MKLPFLLLALAAFCAAPGAHAQDQATIVATCGTAHYTAGGTANRTIDVNGVLCTAGGGSAPVTSVWSVSDAAAAGMTLSNGGLTLSGTTSGATFQVVRNTISKTTGKLYLEFLTNTAVSVSFQIGVASSGVNIAQYLGNSNYSFGENPNAGSIFASTGFSGLTSSNLNVNLPANDVMSIAIDFTANKIWIAHNNVWTDSGNPGTGVNPIQSFVPATVGPLFVALALVSGNAYNWTLQPTAASQTYAPPAGFTPWN